MQLQSHSQQQLSGTGAAAAGHDGHSATPAPLDPSADAKVDPTASGAVPILAETDCADVLLHAGVPLSDFALVNPFLSPNAPKFEPSARVLALTQVRTVYD